MACNYLLNEKGQAVGFACSPGRRREKKCHYCRRSSDKLCDFKLNSGRTCDRRICANCAVHLEPDTDICKSHNEDLSAKLSHGREYEAKYRSICFNPNCRKRVELGEKINWFGTGKILCAECVENLVKENV